MNTIFCLIKFGKKEHLESLMRKGNIRFSPIESFRNSEEKERGDKFEGVFNIINEEFSSIKCEHPILGDFIFKPLPNKLGKITLFNDDPYCSFSSYALTTNLFMAKDFHKIDKRMCEFGEYALVINNPNEFLNRIHKKLSDLKIKFISNLTSYVDLNEKGNIDLDFFIKTRELSHQLEHRILIKTEESKPVYIQIGSLEDFSFISKSNEMIETEFKVIRNQNLQQHK